MSAEPHEMGSKLSDALSRHVRRPALEQTIFQPPDDPAQGPLERLAGLVHTVIDELRAVRRRLSEQAQDLHALRQTVATLNERIETLSAPEPVPVPVPAAHVLLLSTPEGYLLADGEGPVPAPGAELVVDEVRYRVLNRSCSPYPGDDRACALLLPA